jgi:parallel beta-helix repeat protein
VNILQNTIQGYQYIGIFVQLNVAANIIKNRLATSGAAGSSPIGIWMQYVPKGKVVGNVITNDWYGLAPATTTGIRLDSTTFVQIVKNQVNETKYGIELYGGCSAPATDHNTVKNNRLRNGYNTLWLFADTNGSTCPALVTNNLIAGNKLFDFNPPVAQYGLYLVQGSNGGDVSGNKVAGNKVFGFYGAGLVLVPLTLAAPTNTFLGNKLDLTPPGGFDAAPSSVQHDDTIPYQAYPSDVPLP